MNKRGYEHLGGGGLGMVLQGLSLCPETWSPPIDSSPQGGGGLAHIRTPFNLTHEPICYLNLLCGRDIWNKEETDLCYGF